MAKVLVRDKKRGKSFILNVDANARLDQSLRLDITSNLGGHVASLALNQDDLHYLLIPQKKYYQGPAQARAMKAVLSVPLDPKWIYNILFERPLTDEGWACQSEKNRLSVCANRELRLNIRWADRSGNKKTVYLEHPDATLQMNFANYQPNVEERLNLFELSNPKGFKQIKIQ